jgi:L-idonate 5-dehydrogenase
MRPRGVVVQLGLGGEVQLPMTAFTARELELRGSFRFHEEFAAGVDMMRRRLVDVRPLITHTVDLSEAVVGFGLASDRSRAMKVQIEFA